ncbi:MAG: type III-B CRISPR module-associated protein Cmr5 [Lentisphaeria bacterium]
MKNMEQLRSKHALTAAENSFHGRNDGDIIKKVPAMIQQNGFLGALAFAIEDEARVDKSNQARVDKQHENKVSGYALAFQAIQTHLQSCEVAICPVGINTLRAFAEWLCADERDSLELRIVTSEAMAYMNVLRRYAK